MSAPLEPGPTFSRIEIPARTAEHPHEVGGQWEWCWAVALPYRVLAAPRSHLPMPARPRPDVDFFSYLGYWGCLQSFLTYSLGWSRHDRGLLWWYEAGRPVEDPRFALIAGVWERDGLLERYFEWASRHPTAAAPLRNWTFDFDTEPIELPRHWVERFARVREETSGDLSGTTPEGKHLEEGSHVGEPASELDDGVMLITDVADRRALFRHGSVAGWYAALHRAAAALPDIGERSWRVDVFVDPMGYLGSYRRSRITGLWFSGRHRYHSVGN